ncbi:PREDICTED: protein LONGIFOLIA 1-like isoform X2 [Ipomoea nil]|uniref:protein LONGIFOLIA 1-like isoform X2 n=1 Tax=Ipomoea nil TaxID=35883 RepID=UPI0009018D16|nr:PREDICTED: protein LONGIFOLIA 1-like isoform X2 [Ipomoea nil]XP_019182241.1 PREDICTED: protein LONGIFOLIA 1-like isoform X2 [Ipomoea nil]XP_019182242.1 PREDICTED: protein LONGIFOLIA 1-like isoform X2 [Ipomoea nil]
MDGMDDRKMGCMSGFLQLFDRHHILAAKRLYTTKRLLPFTEVNDTSEAKNIVMSQEIAKEWIKSPLPLPIFEVKDGGKSSWKIRKEAPRLSLDSRATVDAKGSLHPKEIQINACENAKDLVVTDEDKQPRCPSVIAKLMGLEALPGSSSETTQKAELRRSASESRVSRDLFQYCFEFNEPNYLQSNIPNVEIDCRRSRSSNRGLSSTSWKAPQHRKYFYETADIIFPEPTQIVPHHGEINKRLRIRGLDEPSNDLESLKHTLEALQLKGLLHTKKPSEQINRLNVVYDPRFSHDESQIVVMKSSRSISLQSPKVISRRNCFEQNSTKRSWNKKSLAQVHQKEKITNFISESSLTAPFQTRGERSNTEYNEGRNLLERCDKLIHSIVEMTATDMQPSPVSVLDSSFFKEDSPSPSPIRKQSIEFLGDFDNEIRAEIPPVQSKSNDETVDWDISYITDILKASDCLPEEPDIFLLLEKQQFLKGKDTSEDSRLQRKLIFDTITEIRDRSRQLPPWKVYSWSNSVTAQPSLQRVLSEFQRIRELGISNDLFEIICGTLKKDLAQDAVNGWGDYPVEMSETVLYMERLIYKDLMGETIRELASFATKSSAITALRRKLVF